MMYCKCGGKAHVGSIHDDTKSGLQRALNIVKRNRVCVRCDSTINTTEVASIELSELRRRAYLWERYVDSEKAA